MKVSKRLSGYDIEKACEGFPNATVRYRNRYNIDKGEWYMTVQPIPFGVSLPNDGTFSKSIIDSDSSLIRVLKFLRYNPWATKREICQHVFGFKFLSDGTALRAESVKPYGVKKYYQVELSGWRSPWFAGIVRAGFVVTAGRPYGYHLTRMGLNLVKLHTDGIV